MLLFDTLVSPCQWYFIGRSRAVLQVSFINHLFVRFVRLYVCLWHFSCCFFCVCFRWIGPRQANLVLMAYASSKGSGEPAHPRSLAWSSVARSYKQWVKRTFRQKARSLAHLNGWACAIKICHDRMLEYTNSLDEAHLMSFLHVSVSSNLLLYVRYWTRCREFLIIVVSRFLYHWCNVTVPIVLVIPDLWFCPMLRFSDRNLLQQ